jgi:hypothetical protein
VPDASQVFDALLKSLGGLFAAKGGLKALKPLFSSPAEKDLAPCNTRIVHDGSGLPWNKQVAIHCSKQGQIEMKTVKGK